MKYETYWGTHAATLNESLRAALAAGATLDLDAFAQKCVDSPAISYGQTVHLSFPLLTLKSKPTRKHLQVSIYRLETGRYELTQYFL